MRTTLQAGRGQVWSDYPKDAVLEVRGVVHDVVTHFRNRGHASAIAIQMAAEALGLTPRRARGLYFSEACGSHADEHRRVLAAYAEHLDQRAAWHVAQAERARVRRREVLAL